MDNLNDIISSLSADDIEMLKGVASSILEKEGAKDEQLAPKSSELPQMQGLDGIDFNMIMKAKALFDKMNSTKSKNADLIMALKPHLSAQTQNKAEQAIKILRLFEILPMLRELF